MSADTAVEVMQNRRNGTSRQGRHSEALYKVGELGTAFLTRLFLRTLLLSAAQPLVQKPEIIDSCLSVFEVY